MAMGNQPDNFFAVSAPGLETLVAEELSSLGISASSPSSLESRTEREYDTGGVSFTGGLDELYRANLHLRTASRVLVRLGDFYAAGFPELRKKAGRLAWERFLQPGQPVDLHVTCHKSRLYHSGAVAERVLAAITDRLGKSVQQGKSTARGEEAEGSAGQIVVVRLAHDHCIISIDSSGALLHRRGYRLATAKAPLRETLAAAMLMAAGWDVCAPLIDPFCGSGTIAIEAALLSRGIPPGSNRQFAFMRWPGYRADRWQAHLAAAQSQSTRQFPVIQASDRDAGAVRIAQENARRAGVEDAIAFTCQAVSAIQPPQEQGWIVTNPPYGVRLSAGKDLRNLYSQIGNMLRARCRGWQVAILCSDAVLLAHVGFHLDTSFSTINGGVSVRLGRGSVP